MSANRETKSRLLHSNRNVQPDEMNAVASKFDAGAGRSRLLRLINVRREEAWSVALACTLYFCVFAGYFAVRPVRESVGTVLGAARVADLFAVTWVAAIVVVPVYGAICARFRRSSFLPWLYGFVAVALGLCGFAFLRDEAGTFGASFFYVLISVLNLFIVSVFWSFLLEMFDAEQSKRLFGVVAAGGTSGALAGPMVTTLAVESIGHAGVLFFGATMFALAIACQRLLLRMWREHPGPTQLAKSGPEAQERPIGGHPFAGFSIVCRSPYLLAISLFVILLAAVNTFLYFEQLRVVQETFASVSDRTRAFGLLDFAVQSLTIICQIFMTGRVATRFGLGVLLVAVPISMVAGLSILGVLHSFSALAVVVVVRRVGEYAFVRPGREMLFAPLDLTTKYKAKNLIDVPVYRGGDALVASLTSSIHQRGWSSAFIGAACALVWAFVGWWLARRANKAT
jgi:AAA family ATP:ADP antiporter